MFKKRNEQGILVTFLKVRRLPQTSGINPNGQPFTVGGEFAVVNSNDRDFEPEGMRWPHILKCASKESAESYVRHCCKPHPTYGNWYEAA
jgi:hypothetical protein